MTGHWFREQYLGRRACLWRTWTGQPLAIKQNGLMKDIRPSVVAVVLGAVLILLGGAIYLSATSSPLGPEHDKSASPTAIRAAVSPGPSTLLVAAASPSGSSVSKASSATANISWTPTSIAPIISPGESVTVSVSFIASKNIRIVTVETSSSLAKLIRVQPTSFEHIRKGQRLVLSVMVAAGAQAPLGTVTGTIQLRRGKVAKNDPDCDDEDRQDPGRLVPQPLNVTVNVWKGLADSGLGIVLKYPPNLFTLRPTERPDELLIQSSASPINLGGVLPENSSSESASGFIIGVTRNSYPKAFTLTQWLSDTYPYSTIDTIVSTTSSGLASYRLTFKGEVGAGEPTVIVPINGDVIEITYASTFASNSPDDRRGLAIYEQVLQTLQIE